MSLCTQLRLRLGWFKVEPRQSWTAAPIFRPVLVFQVDGGGGGGMGGGSGASEPGGRPSLDPTPDLVTGVLAPRHAGGEWPAHVGGRGLSWGAFLGGPLQGQSP